MRNSSGEYELRCVEPNKLFFLSMSARLIFAMFFLLSACCMPAWSATSSADALHVHVQLVFPTSDLNPGAANQAGLYFRLEPGWHVYWKNAGDSGEPPHLKWDLPDGITAGALQFPAPKRLPLGPLMDFGYEGQVLFPFSVDVADTVKPGPVGLKAHADWLVCREVCIPEKANLEVQRQVAASGTAAGADVEQDHSIWVNANETLPTPLPATDKTVFQSTGKGFRLGVDTGHRESKAEFFPADQNILDNPSPQTVTPTPTGLILELTKDANLTANPTELKGVLELSGGRAYDIIAVQGTVAAATPFSWALLARATGLAFLGGLLLNLMPCVFPVLFLKGLALVRSGSEERHSLRLHGYVYAAGIVVSFWVLVGVLLGLRAAGGALGWGFQFQSPVFLSLMAALLFFLGLSLAGQFEIGLSITSAGGSLAAKQGYAGSFFTGVLAVVVATPCTAPFMGAAIGYALAESGGVTFAVFTALALGLAAPYVALTMQPAWTRWLPKPGAWMELLKQAVSVPIFATVIGLAWVLAQAYGATMLAVLLVSFLLLAIAGWFLGRWPAQRWATAVAIVIVICAAGLSVASAKTVAVPGPESGKTLTTHSSSSDEWQPWTADLEAKYKAQGRPVFIDFTASWCLSCQVNERVALDRPEVLKAFRDANVVLLKADWTQHDDALTRALAALGRSGVPAYALYVPGESNPRMLPEVLTPGIVTGALNNLPHATTQTASKTSNSK
jgi:thiol:disulfide interchange protein DsbD